MTSQGAAPAQNPLAFALELRIEELVLHGFPTGDRYALAAAVEQELSRLFAEHGLPPALAGPAHAGRVDAGAFDAAPGASAAALGAQVALAVYRSLGGAADPRTASRQVEGRAGAPGPVTAPGESPAGPGETGQGTRPS